MNNMHLQVGDLTYISKTSDLFFFFFFFLFIPDVFVTSVFNRSLISQQLPARLLFDFHNNLFSILQFHADATVS